MDGIGGGRGGRGGHMTPKTNFSPGPAIGARAAAMCPSFAMRTKRRGSGHREERRGEERYKLFESRVEAEGPEERERSASATVEQEGGYPLFGEGERKTWEDAR